MPKDFGITKRVEVLEREVARLNRLFEDIDGSVCEMVDDIERLKTLFTAHGKET